MPLNHDLKTDEPSEGYTCKGLPRCIAPAHLPWPSPCSQSPASPPPLTTRASARASCSRAASTPATASTITRRASRCSTRWRKPSPATRSRSVPASSTLRGVDPETFLHGPVHASGGYGDADHYYESRPLAGALDRHRRRRAVSQCARRARLLLGRERRRRAAQRVLVRGRTRAASSRSAAAAACTQGIAGQFPCRNLDFPVAGPLAQFSSRPVSAANVWGFVDLNDNREYAVLGLRNGTAIVEVTDPANPREVDHDCRQPVAVARGQGLSSVRRRRESLARVCVRRDRSGQQRRADRSTCRGCR